MNSHDQDTVILKGVGVSSGIAVGKAFLVDRGDIEFPFYYSLRNQEEVEQEQTMFLEAVEATRNEL
ncbi:MAG TPA: phosphoenolpyruvate-utilizing N-terminal domain-containing protein, partial [Thermodesulfobacteriota bacterium]|nr:phosphoenolpyruvate-utilizing N-terminal domain-containing protein [Thermodesulfobacteriota bacterium]